MFEKLMTLYVTAMTFDVRSPMPHIVGPPGSGKSSVIEQLAGLLDVELHIINVSRLSPLEVEGVQMPHGSGEDMVLRMLPATFWTSLKEGDILLMDEFLRGFPEVYNGLLDIFTSRRVGAYRLPKVFIVGASNSVVSYDPALEDRLLHIPVNDPRRSKSEGERLGLLLCNEVGLLPEMATSLDMETLLTTTVYPMFDVLDVFKKKAKRVVEADVEGVSLRNLIGQAQLRHVVTPALKEVILMNNLKAMKDGKAQFVVLLSGKETEVPHGYESIAMQLEGNPKLSPLQAKNIRINLQLIEMEKERRADDDV